MLKVLYGLLAFFTFFFLFFFIYPAYTLSASYDFELITKNPDAKLQCAVPSPLKVVNGLLGFSTQCSWEKQRVTVTLKGEYHPKEKLLEGNFEWDSRYTVKNYKGEVKTYYTTETCSFRAGPIDAETETVRISATKNCSESSNMTGENVTRDTGGVDLGEYRVVWNGEEKKENKPEDSGIRFSDLAGEIDILVPSGYDKNGEPLYENEDEWQYAKLDMELPYGTKIRLREKSGIMLSFPDMTTYQMTTPENLYPYGETILILPSKAKNDNVLKLMAGQLWNNVKKMVKDGSMVIEMGQAVAGIKGTTFILEEDGKTSRISVLEGTVELRSKKGNEIQTVTAGKTVTADNRGPGTITYFDIHAEEQKWKFMDTLKWKKNNTQEMPKTTPITFRAVGGIVFFAVIILLFIKNYKRK